MTEENTAGSKSSRLIREQTYYEILGVPIGASINHIKDSYRLLTRKTTVTDVAFQTLINPDKRSKYDAWLIDKIQASSSIPN
jgi:DnaJ-class molecular chaperone